MDLEIIIAGLAQLAGTGGILFWLLKRHAAKIDRLIVDVEVVKTIVATAREDHDNLIMLRSRVEKLSDDINHAHEKIRRQFHG